MRRASLGLVVVVAVVAIGAAAWLGFRHRSDESRGALVPELATPLGVTLESLRAASRLGAAAPTVYADAAGLTLYQYDKDPATCATGCRKFWHPAAAPAGARAFGDWAVIDDQDDGRSWTLKGRRLYHCSDDAEPGETKCDGRDGAWHMASYHPDNGVPMPVGIGLRELPNGGGEGFIDDQGKTLYAFGANGSAQPNASWKAASAPEMAGRIGEFAAVTRPDGVRQWTYSDRPLYRFAGDSEPGDANGAGADPRFHVALLQGYFMPPDAAVSHNPALGDILTAGNGMTLYARDRFIDTDGHNFRTDHGTPATGRALGVGSCDGECLHSWRPFKAPGGAMASGYWDVFRRPDGTMQWAYKGYALYFYEEDRAPGDVRGNERYTLNPLRRDDPAAPAAVAQAAVMTAEGAAPPGTGVGALFWRAVTP